MKLWDRVLLRGLPSHLPEDASVERLRFDAVAVHFPEGAPAVIEHIRSAF